jgi:hypothetical protein
VAIEASSDEVMGLDPTTNSRMRAMCVQSWGWGDRLRITFRTAVISSLNLAMHEEMISGEAPMYEFIVISKTQGTRFVCA